MYTLDRKWMRQNFWEEQTLSGDHFWNSIFSNWKSKYSFNSRSNQINWQSTTIIDHFHWYLLRTGMFSVNSLPPPPPPPPHWFNSPTPTNFYSLQPPTDLTPPPPTTIMDMRINKNNRRRNVLTHARVNFSQSETSSLLRGGRELNFELLLSRGVNRKDPRTVTIYAKFGILLTSTDCRPE